MPIHYHPQTGSIVVVDFATGFVPPEMVKKRLAVVISPPIKARFGLCTVVPLSLTPPKAAMPYHCEVRIPFEMPRKWGGETRWVKGDMVCSASFRRINLLLLRKDANGNRVYQTEALPSEEFQRVKKCVLHGLGLSSLTKHL